MLVLIAALIVVLMWKRHTISSFPSEINDTEQENESFSATDLTEQNQIAVQTQQSEIKTTCDTICIYEDIDQKDGSMEVTEAKLPAKYIGLKREELEAALSDDSKVYTLDDKQKGFKSQHLELFSAEQIKILRIYDSSPQLTGYYIMEIDGEIIVYESDKKTLFFRTGLNPDNLPENIRRQVLEGKFLETEIQVYHFIESYSS
jgi:phage antirepressor YoqD-like protein